MIDLVSFTQAVDALKREVDGKLPRSIVAVLDEVKTKVLPNVERIREQKR